MAKNIQMIVEELVKPYLEDNGFELVDVEYVTEGKNRFLRVYVDKEGGIDIEDCSAVSEYLSRRLDETDPIPDAYFLEVSSPGAERPLKKPRDFEQATGRHIYVTTYEPVEGRKEFEGTLSEYREDEIVVEVGRQTVAIPLNKVANARLAVLF